MYPYFTTFSLAVATAIIVTTNDRITRGGYDRIARNGDVRIVRN